MMPLGYSVLLLVNPQAGWKAIHDRSYNGLSCFFGHTVLLALIPPLAAYYGTTQIGWQIGDGEVTRLTSASAGGIAVLYYLVMLAATIAVGWITHWMTRTYGANRPIGQCFALASFTATPLFLIGMMGVFPVLWLNLLLGLGALSYTTFLFFSGVPVMMEIGKERGFLFASAVMVFGLVTLVATLGVCVMLWSLGFEPEFTY